VDKPPGFPARGSRPPLSAKKVRKVVDGRRPPLYRPERSRTAPMNHLRTHIPMTETSSSWLYLSFPGVACR
jgi:hypothetical protein